MDARILLYIFFGILPSLTWLLYYLKKDAHPEPKKMILKVFIWGALITIPVFFAQIGSAFLLDKLNLPSLAYSLIYWFLIIAFTEEIFKYLVIRLKVLNNPELDEPVDLMLYMVIAALGFAALENILYLLSPVPALSFNDVLNRTMLISFVRFIGATFLHTLCSALLGYFLAMSVCSAKNKIKILLAGIIIATGLHGLYDFSIMAIESSFKLLLPLAILILLSLFVLWAFSRLKKLKGICKINIK